MAVHSGCVVVVIVSLMVQLSLSCCSGVGEEGYFVVCHDLGCQSLADVASEVISSNLNNVSVEIQEPNIVLYETVSFHNLRSIRIHGDVIITCASSNVGLVFTAVDSLTIEGISLSHCGAVIKHTSIEYNVSYEFSAAVSVLRCGEVMISRVIVANSNGTGLFIHHTEGILIDVSHSKFIENVFLESDMFGGGGIYLTVTGNSTRDTNQIIITSCHFEGNIPSNTPLYEYIFTDEYGQPLSGRGRGGGMSVALEENTQNNFVYISKCNFTHNSGFLGAGLLVKMEAGVHGSLVVVEDSLFDHNGCQLEDENYIDKTGAGGGLFLTFRIYHRPLSTNNKMLIRNNTFVRNCAVLGGGTYFFTGRSEYEDFNNTVDFKNCTWQDNFAHTGSAVDITPNIFDRLSSGFLPIPTFENCSFINNSVRHRKYTSKQDFGEGTLYASLFSVRFLYWVEFHNNTGSAIVVVNGVADFANSDATFRENEAVQGGALSLVGLSSMILGENHSYLFKDNMATDRGGAIYSHLVDEHDLIVSRSCFIQYSPAIGSTASGFSKWNNDVTFIGNRANQFGHAIFATSLIPCQVVQENNTNFALLNISEIFHWHGIVFDRDVQPQVSTEGARFSYNSAPFEIVPGEETKLNVHILDDLGLKVDTTLRASFQSPTNKHGIVVDSAFSCISNQTVRVRGTPGHSGNLVLQTVTVRKISLVLQVKLVDCPPGFTLRSDECICNSHSYVSLMRCNETHHFSVMITGFWVGAVSSRNTTELASSICPLGFCNYNRTDSTALRSVPLPRNWSELDEAMCGTTRTGILCSDCRDGYTVHYHSPHFECQPVNHLLCKFGWLFFILSELVPVTLLCVLVLTLNISFTSGGMNGFILFSQLLDTLLIDASGIIKFPRTIKILTIGHQIIYGFFNLEYFNIKALSFCIWSNTSVLDALAFKYVTVAYALFLIVSIIFFMKKCGARCLRITTIRNSTIHGLSAFMVVCYTQCIKTSLRLLFGRDLILPTHSTVSIERRVWFGGNIAYFSREHLPYAIPAIFCLLTIGIPLPLLLLAYPLTNKLLAYCRVEETPVVKFVSRLLPIAKLKPLLDTFQGSFRDNYRFFAGLYFLYRWTASLLYVHIISYSIFYSIVELLLIVILAIHSIYQPYTKRRHNLLDTLLFTDLALINAITSLHYFHTRVRGGLSNYFNISATATVQTILIYIPIVYLLVYFSVRVCKRYVYKHSVYQRQDEQELTTLKKVIGRSFSWVKGDSSDEEELPHRMIAEDQHDYEAYEDTMSDSGIINVL